MRAEAMTLTRCCSLPLAFLASAVNPDDLLHDLLQDAALEELSLDVIFIKDESGRSKVRETKRKKENHELRRPGTR